MADAEVGQIYLVSAVGLLNGQTTITTFHYEIQSLAGPAVTVGNVSNALNVALDQAGGLMERYTDCLPDNLTIQYNEIQCIWPQRYYQQRYTPDFPNGNVGSDATTSNVMAAITRRGFAARRADIGRILIPAPTTAVEQATGLWAAGYKALLDLLAPQLYQSHLLALGGSTANLIPVVYNRGSVVPRTPIYTAYASNVVRVMNRRTVGRGI
jgi:hypothetical protein